MSASTHEALVRQAIETIWNRGDLDAADELFAPGYVNHYGLIADLVLGPEAIKVSAALYRVAFPGLHVTRGGDQHGRRHGRAPMDCQNWPRHDWLAALVASKPKSLTGITRSRFAGGKIVESWTEWVGFGVLRELGIPT